jgi:hypothetical protein
MNMPTRWRAVLIAVALPLLYLPLRAAETPPVPLPAEQPEATQAPESEPATEREPEAAPAPAEEPLEEVSADNNLSFPVDI